LTRNQPCPGTTPPPWPPPIPLGVLGSRGDIMIQAISRAKTGSKQAKPNHVMSTRCQCHWPALPPIQSFQPHPQYHAKESTKKQVFNAAPKKKVDLVITLLPGWQRLIWWLAIWGNRAVVPAVCTVGQPNFSTNKGLRPPNLPQCGVPSQSLMMIPEPEKKTVQPNGLYSSLAFG